MKLKPDAWADRYWEEWTDYLWAPAEENIYRDKGRHAEVVAESATKKAVQAAALFPAEYHRFQAWLAEVGQPGLYAKFEEQLRQEHAEGLYPGVPVSQVSKGFLKY